VRPQAASAAGFALALLLSGCGGDPPAAADATVAPPPESPAAQATAAPAAAPPAAADAASTTGPAAPAAGGTLGIVQGYLEAWNAHDVARAAMYFDENAEYFDAAFGGVQRGRAAIAENAIGAFLRGVPDLRWEVRSPPIVGPDGVAFEWTLTGTHTGTWGGVRATNQKIQLKGLSFVRIRDGKITYQSQVYDSAALNRQLGL
jgi:steroid delta-isomerase-like uncharacterized protein